MTQDSSACEDAGLRLAYSLADQSLSRTKSIGILNVSVELCRALMTQKGVKEMGILTNDELAAHVGGSTKSRLIRDADAAGSRWGRIRYDQWRAYGLAKGIGLPWLFLPKGYASFVRRCPVKLACYVHDAMQEHYKDYYPGHFS